MSLLALGFAGMPCPFFLRTLGCHQTPFHLLKRKIGLKCGYGCMGMYYAYKQLVIDKLDVNSLIHGIVRWYWLLYSQWKSGKV